MLGEETQLQYEARATASEQVRQQGLQDKLEELDELIHKSAAVDLSKAEAHQAAFKLSRCAWSMADIADILTLFASDEWSVRKVPKIAVRSSVRSRATRTIAPVGDGGSSGASG